MWHGTLNLTVSTILPMKAVAINLSNSVYESIAILESAFSYKTQIHAKLMQA